MPKISLSSSFLSIYKIWPINSGQVTGKYIKSEIDRNCNRNHNTWIKCDEPLDNQDLTDTQGRPSNTKPCPLNDELPYCNMNGK